MVHQPASSSLQWGMSTKPGVTTWFVGVCSRRDVCCVCVRVFQRWHSGDGCDLASTLCMYDLRKGELFVGHGCDE